MFIEKTESRARAILVAGALALGAILISPVEADAQKSASNTTEIRTPQTPFTYRHLAAIIGLAGVIVAPPLAIYMGIGWWAQRK